MRAATASRPAHTALVSRHERCSVPWTATEEAYLSDAMNAARKANGTTSANEKCAVAAFLVNRRFHHGLEVRSPLSIEAKFEQLLRVQWFANA